MNSQLKAYSDRVNVAVRQAANEILQQLEQHLKSSDYKRGKHLVRIMKVEHNFEVATPNLVNPTEDEIAGTVHIISRLESQLIYERTKVESGLYNFDFNKHANIAHALRNESAILKTQVDILNQALVMDEVKSNKVQDIKKPVLPKLHSYDEAVKQGMPA